MIIHVVSEGDTLTSIANTYGVSVAYLTEQNQITNPDNLLLGQNIVVQIPTVTYTVQAGDTLASIAEEYGKSVINLLQNNPSLSLNTGLQIGQSIIIDYGNQKIGSMSVNGYAYPFINSEVLTKTLPYLTSITIFTYGFTPEGALIPIDDAAVIATAREYNVAPIMLISTLSQQGTFSDALANTLLTNEALQDTLINNIISNMQAKGYYGLDIDFEFIYPEDADRYVAFVEKIRTRLNAVGFELMVALAPKTSSDQPGTLYEGHKYQELGAAANTALIMTYEWGYTYGPPMAVSPLNKVREVMDYAVQEISPDKIYMGVPNYAYDWTLPYVKGTSRARSLGNVEAVDQAIRYNVPIQFDTLAQTPYYNYQADDGSYHEVWFENAQSIDAKLKLVPDYGIRGVAYWNLMKYFPQNWLVLNGLFNVTKVSPPLTSD
ncbi:MAG: glycosyl hydrolase family 18 protein [bacterium]|nr:glycosyl hydrolase family 18 protein [bacterium]